MVMEPSLKLSVLVSTHEYHADGCLIRLYTVSVCCICSTSLRMQVVVRESRNRWVSLVLILGMTWLYVDGRRIIVWFKDRLDSWIDKTMVNDVNNLKSATPY